MNTWYLYNSLPIASMVQSFEQSNMPGKVIIVVLILFSIWGWTVMATKLTELKQGERLSNSFLRAFRAEKHPLNLFLNHKKLKKAPLIDIYQRSCDVVTAELEAQGVEISDLAGASGGGGKNLTVKQIEVIRNLSERNVADQVLLLEKNVNFLATAVSTAPFLGLLGTVWGVMEAFSAMAITGAPTLAAVAPGISAALLTTVVALLVALPSAIGYNIITNKIRSLSVQMDNFSQEFVAEIQHALLLEET